MPITGIDHVMLAVADLDTAVAGLAGALGLHAVRGGVHPDFGTANKVVHIPGLYLEMITDHDRAVAGGLPVGRRIIEVSGEGGGWLAFVLGVDDLVGTVEELNAAGLALDPPISGHAVRPDGSIRGFSLGGYGEEFAAGLLPSLISYTHPPQADPHPDDLGYTITGLSRADVAVADIAAGIRRYTTLFGEPPAVRGVDPVLDVATASWRLADGTVVRLIGPGAAIRPGLFGVALAVADVDAAAESARARGVELSKTGIDGEILLDPDRTLNARISFVPTD
ncbi:VOC family protein [Kutzneria chonburiensis]|uniref:VOC family protein n=1 Tax=Kutzneria chonburiensis TaxID=1483604 RepID=A0ABV6MK19_9PSEU|nr:VOC family protein [Kutzneria chonburiensis]